MSSESTFTSDLRSAAMDYKRDAARKHKNHKRMPIELRPVVRYVEPPHNLRRREANVTVGALALSGKIALKHGTVENGADDAFSSDGNSSDSVSNDGEATTPAADADVMYSFDAPTGPTLGSQVLNGALVQAMERFKEKETVKLVKDEYDVLDSDGESVGLTPAGRKGGPAFAKGRGSNSRELAGPTCSSVAEDEEYEFV